MFPDSYPFISCDENVLFAAQNIIHQAHVGIKTKYVTLEEGYIKIVHLTNCTREWLTRSDSNSFLTKLQLEFRLNLKYKSSQYFDKRISLSCVLKYPIDDADLITTILRENDIKTSRCKFEKCEALSNGFKIYFGVTPMCFKMIHDRDYSLKIRQMPVKVKIGKMQYAELFSDFDHEQ